MGFPRLPSGSPARPAFSRRGLGPAAAVIIFLIAMAGPALARPNPCRQDPAFQAFAFWVGSFTVSRFDAPDAIVGRNRIRSVADGCALLEEWEGASGGHGISLTRYDPVRRLWTHHWAAPGYVIDLQGGPDGKGGMMLEGAIRYADGRGERAFRGHWLSLGEGRVRQTFTERDPVTGKWAVWFDGLYVPINRDGKP